MVSPPSDVTGDPAPESSRSATRAQLRRLPKAELHLHLDGSLRAETLLEMSRTAGVPLPVGDVDALRRYMVAPSGGSLTDYLERFEITLAVMQTARAIERITYELAEDLAAENVRYAEIRFSPILNTREGLAPEAAVEASLEAMRRAEAQLDIRLGLIVCAIRSMPPADAVRMAELAARYRADGVVGFDLAGGEAGNPPAAHGAAFAVARRANLGITVHAGEAFGPESIAQALHDCGAHRIGHGTRLEEDPELLAYVRDFQIPVEACLTSNVQTGAVSSLAAHPLPRYFEEGVALSVNTDNRMVSGVTLTDELLAAHEVLGLGWRELAGMMRSAVSAGFLPLPEKHALLARFDAEVAGLDPELSR